MALTLPPPKYHGYQHTLVYVNVVYEQLMEHCERVPHYTPVAKFRAVYGGAALSDFSGIFVGCTDNGFKANILNYLCRSTRL